VKISEYGKTELDREDPLFLEKRTFLKEHIRELIEAHNERNR